MTVSSLVGGVAFASLGMITSPIGYFAAWVFLGAAMAGVLYEPAFAVITEHFAQHYRRGITVVTLAGGLASTAFIPVANVYVERFGWRDALIGMGLFQAFAGGAWHWFVVPARAKSRATRQADENPPLKMRDGVVEWRDRRFAGLAVWFAAHAATFSGTILLLVPVLQASGVPNAMMLQAIVLIGPMQVIGRLVLAGWIDHFSSLQVGRWITLLLVLALALVSAFPPTTIVLVLFSMLYGVANGVTTILRGTVVAEIFGRDRYPLISGALSFPSVLAKAAAPLICAAIWDATGSAQSVFVMGFLFAIVGAIGMRWAARAVDKDTSDFTTSMRPMMQSGEK
jgi:MFS family permease